MQEGVPGPLRDKSRPSHILPLPRPVIERVIEMTTQDPPHEATHWTARAMAEAVGTSVSSVQRIWRAYKLQPDRVCSFGGPAVRRQAA